MSFETFFFFFLTEKPEKKSGEENFDDSWTYRNDL